MDDSGFKVWRPWESSQPEDSTNNHKEESFGTQTEECARNLPESEAETEPFEKKKVWAYSEEVQQLILNCYKYFEVKAPSHPLKETCEALKISRTTIQRVVKRRKVRKANRKTNKSKKFSKIDSFMKDLIRRTVYEFYDERIAPTLDMLHKKILEKTRGEDYEFSYGRTTLFEILKSLGFHYCRNNNRKVLMESHEFKPCVMSFSENSENFEQMATQ